MPALLSSSRSAFQPFLMHVLYAGRGFTLPIQVPTPCGTAATLITFAFSDFAVFTSIICPPSTCPHIRTFRITGGIGGGTGLSARALVHNTKPASRVATPQMIVMAILCSGPTPVKQIPLSVVKNIANLSRHGFEQSFVATAFKRSLPHGIDVRIVQFRRRQVTNRAVN